MARRTGDTDAPAAPAAGVGLPRMLMLDQVKEVLNVNSPLVYALVRSGSCGPRSSAAAVILGNLSA